MTIPKVCVVTNQYPPQWNGVARSCSRLVQYLVEEGYDVYVIAAVYEPPKDANTPIRANVYHTISSSTRDELGAYVYRLETSELRDINSELINLLIYLDTQHRFDIFHGYWLPYAFAPIVVAGTRPVIASIRGSDANEALGRPNVYGHIEKVLEKASWITSVSSDLLQTVNSIVDISDKSSLVLNGIDTTNFPKWSFSDCHKGSVGTAGQMRFKKGIPILINGYEKVPSSLRTQLRLIGPLQCMAEVEYMSSIVSELGINDECICLGFMERLKLLEEICKLNVFVIPSLHDGLPNALLEAAGCGLPIVATNVGGMADILTDEENALVVDPGDTEGIGKAIARVLRDERLANKISRGALELANKLNYQQEKEAWLNVYHRDPVNHSV